MEWKTIESAPKDGNPFIGALLWLDAKHVHIQEWEVHEWEWCSGRGYFVRPYDEMPDNDTQPTHWMSLPSPPTEEVSTTL